MKFIDDPIWWFFKHSGCARYLLHKLYTEFLYDLELSQIDYKGMKDKWLDRLFRLDRWKP